MIKRIPVVLALLCCTALPTATAQTAAQTAAPSANPDSASYAMPPLAIANALRTDKNIVDLQYLSPDGDHFLVPHVTELSTLDLMSRPTYRLAELQLRPDTDRLWQLDTYGIDGFRFYSLSARRFIDVDLPAGSFASDFTWSPDGARIAFLAHLPSHTELWTADAATGRTRSLSARRVLATVATGTRGQGTRPSSMIQWTPNGSLITLLVPADRGTEPARNRIPDGPVTRRTRDMATSTRTYPNLLEDAHDETLFEHFTRSQIVEISTNGSIRPIGKPGMYTSLSLSPDGLHLLAERIERPFSYRTSYSGFPRRTVVIDTKTAAEVEMQFRPLREGSQSGSDRESGPRAFAWIPGASGLTFLSRAEESDDEPDEPRPDRVMRAEAPFSIDDAVVIASSEDPIGTATFARDGRRLFATVTNDGKSGLAMWRVDADSSERSLILDFEKTDDPTADRGDLSTGLTANGLSYARLSSDQGHVFLTGRGYRADFRPQPFVDRVSLSDTTATRIFEGSSTAFEQPRLPLDLDFERLIVRRESQTDIPDSYLWTTSGSENLTRNEDPFPAVTASRRIDFEFTRRDGLPVQGRVSLPVGYQEGTKVPAIFWTYPREYTKPEGYSNAAIRSRNHNDFTEMSWLRWSNLWLMQGYALVYPDIPIVGENYNDTYIADLVDAMYGAIRAVDRLGVIDIDRIGHGGHSYGAFATANILANAPFFKAGIAGDGAYNRSLTPSGFQSERRPIWEAPHTYLEMSPFFKADQIEAPLLMYHGGDDNNTGTFPMQSRRMIHALTEQGKTAVLYEYPYESHTPRAIENKLDMWARFIDWFDTYVKSVDDGTDL